MKAIGKFILIHEIKEQQITESGILLTADDTNQQRYKKGSVIVPGTDVDTVFEGDIIYYDAGAGHDMLIEDNPYTIIQERDVVVVL